MQHIIIWELGQDVHPDTVNEDPRKTSQLRAVFEKKLENHSTKGDFDGDGDVDANDFTVWNTTVGATGKVRADGNGDRIVDAADYVLWRKFASADSGSGSSVTVPEPHITSIVCVGLLILTSLRRSRLAC
jgi:hypothetical protein